MCVSVYCLYTIRHVQCLAHLRMDLDIANKRLETVDEEKRKLMQERDEVGIAYSWAGCELCAMLLLHNSFLYTTD